MSRFAIDTVLTSYFELDLIDGNYGFISLCMFGRFLSDWRKGCRVIICCV